MLFLSHRSFLVVLVRLFTSIKNFFNFCYFLWNCFFLLYTFNYLLCQSYYKLIETRVEYVRVEMDSRQREKIEWIILSSDCVVYVTLLALSIGTIKGYLLITLIFITLSLEWWISMSKHTHTHTRVCIYIYIYSTVPKR